jgi:hypothetical protein
VYSPQSRPQLKLVLGLVWLVVLVLLLVLGLVLILVSVLLCVVGGGGVGVVCDGVEVTRCMYTCIYTHVYI